MFISDGEISLAVPIWARLLIGGRDDAAVAVVPQAFEHAADRLDADRGGNARAFVKQQNVPRGEVAEHALDNLVGVGAGAFEAARGPSDIGQTAFATAMRTRNSRADACACDARSRARRR